MTQLLFNHPQGRPAAAASFGQSSRRAIISSLLLVVAAVSAIGTARAVEQLPSQEQALTQALENSPDIVAAKAKVALAEAELYGKRTDVSRQVLALYGSLKTLDAQVDAAKAALSQSKAELERVKALGNVVDQSTKAAAQAAQLQLVEALGRREQAQNELRLLVGDASRTKEAKSPEKIIPLRQMPQSPIVDTWKKVEQKPIQLSFTDIPLNQVMSDLSEKMGIKFSIQEPVFAELGSHVDMPISLSTSQVPLRAALQAFEDAYPELQFVLRDYGILLTTKEYAAEHGYMPALELDAEGSSRIKPRY